MKQNDQYHISKSVRRMIVFATHNMFSDPPFGKLDLISCRNVMIYFQPVMRRGLFAIFHSALKNGGFLFLGKSETAGSMSASSSPCARRRRSTSTRRRARWRIWRLPPSTSPNVQNIALKNIHAGMSQSDDTTEESRYTRFLEHHLPASVVIGEGRYGAALLRRLQPVSDPGPRPGLPELLLHAVQGPVPGGGHRHQPLAAPSTPPSPTPTSRWDTPSGRKVIDLTVEPIPGQEGENELAAVLFLDRSADRPGGVVEKYDLDATAARRISDLEREFQVSQRDLRSTIQRLETVNGELQAANEELLTANEELQSSTEELQSVNEELYTVNTEHQLKLDELTTMTNDLSNFLSSTMIGILFVDGDLNIRKFTEYVGREFQLMEHDVGRNIQIFAHSFPEEAIEADCRTVLRDLVSIDREVTAMNGRCLHPAHRALPHHGEQHPGGWSSPSSTPWARSGSPGPAAEAPARSRREVRDPAARSSEKDSKAGTGSWYLPFVSDSRSDRCRVRPPPCCRSPA